MSSSLQSNLKHANEELDSKSDATVISRNTTANQRPNTAPEKVKEAIQPSSFSLHGFPKDQPKLPVARSFSSTVATLSTQTSNVSTAVTSPDAQLNSVTQLQEMQAQLDREYDEYVEGLEHRDRKAHVDDFDWGDLESRYLDEMEPAIRTEQEIYMEIAKLYQNMLLWMQTSSDREAQRGIKRLRTRIAFVQISEDRLNQKEAHYSKVLNAFQSTMALFNGP